MKSWTSKKPKFLIIFLKMEKKIRVNMLRAIREVDDSALVFWEPALYSYFIPFNGDPSLEQVDNTPVYKIVLRI